MTRNFLAVIAAAILTFTAGFETSARMQTFDALRHHHHPVRVAPKANKNLLSQQEAPPSQVRLVVPQLPWVEGKSPNVGADGYLFEQATAWNTDFHVVVHTYPTLGDLRQARAAEDHTSVGKFNTLIAYTYVPDWTNGNTCTINIVDPRKLYWPEYIGHEFVHCIADNFHPKQDVLGKVDPTK